MKKVVSFIICLVLAVGLYIPCRDLAVLERGYTDAIGGEVLVPFAVMIAYVWYADWAKEEA